MSICSSADQTIESMGCETIPPSESSPSNDGGYEIVNVPDWIEDVRRQFRALSALQDDWDGYGALRPSDACLEEAGVILLEKCVYCVPKPQLGPTPDGGVGFEFAYGGRELEIEITPELDLDILRTCEDGRTEEKSGPRDIRRLIAFREIDWLVTGR